MLHNRKWEDSIHQTAFSYLKHHGLIDALELLKKSDLILESSSDVWYEGDRELTGWHLYIQVPMEYKHEFTGEVQDVIFEAYGESFGSDDYLREIHVEIKKITDSEFHFNFQDRMATLEKKYDYDVALSFAGEDREYVERVANCLLYKDVRVFYDRFKTVENWGKDLYIHFDEIYRKKARYCVMFLSKSYAGKLWTDHERENAQARAFQDKEEYILPVRFDHTEIPGIRPTIGYIDANDFEPEELAEMIVEKIKN
ncbi:toll/interleukin-1 receptor domain-containing protein [Methanobacterium sp.]|uniref:toll/interleukin-1 receptor domain-containing protein n=1 Tax=Methanobacterium sp. TaxID=2164 RepID=UPI002ABA85D9|nr:TIR domain-containing protein [Methanobacterium sp.]MDY9922763.1 TIR domain-containing protein [Methanobacterium sp.]